jgi:hypothetical protein
MHIIYTVCSVLCGTWGHTGLPGSSQALKSCVLSCFPNSYLCRMLDQLSCLDLWPPMMPQHVILTPDTTWGSHIWSLAYVLFCLPGKTNGLVEVRSVGQQIVSCPSVYASVVVFLQLHQKGGVMVALLRVGHTRLAHGRSLPAPVRACCGETPYCSLYSIRVPL